MGPGGHSPAAGQEPGESKGAQQRKRCAASKQQRRRSRGPPKGGKKEAVTAPGKIKKIRRQTAAAPAGGVEKGAKKPSEPGPKKGYLQLIGGCERRPFEQKRPT
jgi:hypothetical protein